MYVYTEDGRQRVRKTISYMTDVFDRLVSEDGCPWDKEQTHESLKRFLLEESYEVIEAIEKEDDEGDCRRAWGYSLTSGPTFSDWEKEGYFDFYDVLASIEPKSCEASSMYLVMKQSILWMT